MAGTYGERRTRWVACWSPAGYEVVSRLPIGCGAQRYPYPAVMDIVLWLALFLVGGIVGWVACRTRGRGSQPATQGAHQEARDDGRVLVDIAAVVDGLPLPALVTDRQGRIGHVNALVTAELPALERGIDPGVVSASLSEIIQRSMAGEQSSTTERVIIGEPPRSLQVMVVCADFGALVTFADVTEDVDFEEARRTFSAAVSHELRTPLARILGLAETLALPDLEDEREDLVLQIEHEVEGIRKLIDEMLLLAALDRGRLAVADGVVDGCAVTRRVVDEARQRRVGRGHELRVSAPGDLEIPVAARLFEVVVQNLVDNALIHGGDGASVEVELTQVGDMAHLTVTDTGIGIPAQHLPYIFQRFYRGDASRTGPGSGLGLALVKHIVEAHGGDVSAESDGSTGTTVRVTLPVVVD